MRGQGKAEISLRRDQWSCVEKRLIELRRRGGRKEDKSGGAWLRRRREALDAALSPLTFADRRS